MLHEIKMNKYDIPVKYQYTKKNYFSESGNQNINNSNNQNIETFASNNLHSNIKCSMTSAENSTSKAPKPRQKYLHCVSCNSPFSNAWDLMVHVQAAHMMNIYQLADSNKLQHQVDYKF